MFKKLSVALMRISFPKESKITKLMHPSDVQLTVIIKHSQVKTWVSVENQSATNGSSHWLVIRSDVNKPLPRNVSSALSPRPLAAARGITRDKLRPE